MLWSTCVIESSKEVLSLLLGTFKLNRPQIYEIDWIRKIWFGLLQIVLKSSAADLLENSPKQRKKKNLYCACLCKINLRSLKSRAEIRWVKKIALRYMVMKCMPMLSEFNKSVMSPWEVLCCTIRLLPQTNRLRKGWWRIQHFFCFKLAEASTFMFLDWW